MGADKEWTKECPQMVPFPTPRPPHASAGDHFSFSGPPAKPTWASSAISPSKREQNEPTQNMSLWYIYYFELIFCSTGEGLKLSIINSYPFVREMYIRKRLVPGRKLVSERTFSPEWLICLTNNLCFPNISSSHFPINCTFPFETLDTWPFLQLRRVCEPQSSGCLLSFTSLWDPHVYSQN